MRSLSENDLQWFAARLSIAVYDTNREHRLKMSVQIDGLTDMVKFVQSVASQASEAAARLQVSGSRVDDKLSMVNELVAQVDKADAALGAALGVMTNGGPPLNDPLPPVEFVPK